MPRSKSIARTRVRENAPIVEIHNAIAVRVRLRQRQRDLIAVLLEEVLAVAHDDREQKQVKLVRSAHLAGVCPKG